MRPTPSGGGGSNGARLASDRSDGRPPTSRIDDGKDREETAKMRGKSLKELEELRHGQVAPKAKPIKNSSDEEVTEQAGRKAKPIKNGGNKEGTVARRARFRAKSKCAKRRVAEIQAELEALDDTVATRTGGASSLARPSAPEGTPDNWRRLEGWWMVGRRGWHLCNVISPNHT